MIYEQVCGVKNQQGLIIHSRIVVGEQFTMLELFGEMLRAPVVRFHALGGFVNHIKTVSRLPI